MADGVAASYIGGLGFGMKWDMGWMHDTLLYFSKDPIHRKYHHNKLTFRGLYMFTENYVLPLSHDEVVYGKGSLLGKMAGDEWQRFANLRLLFGYMYTQPGKKLLFMGGEIAQSSEWNHDSSLDVGPAALGSASGSAALGQRSERLLSQRTRALRARLQPRRLAMDRCRRFRQQRAHLHALWPRPRSPGTGGVQLHSLPRRGYRVGVPFAGHWREMLNSNAKIYGGTDEGNFGGVMSDPIPYHGHPQSLLLNLPPLAVVMLKR